MSTYNEAVNLIRRLELSRHTELEAAVTETYDSTRGILVLTVDRLLKCKDRDTVVGKFFRDNLYANLSLESACYLRLKNAGYAFYLVLQIFSEILKAY